MIVADFKAATGLSDREIAPLLGVARSTVQAGLAGAMTLKLTPDALAALASVVTARRAMLDKLAAELST